MTRVLHRLLLGAGRRWVPLIAAAVALSGAGSTVVAADEVVYADSLLAPWADWSWATRNLAQTAVVQSGTAAISFEPDGWAGLYFHRGAPVSTSNFTGFEFWVRGAGAGGQNVRVLIRLGATNRVDRPIGNFLPGGTIPSGSWVKGRVDFAALGLGTTTFDDIYFQDGSGGNQATVYLDQLVLTGVPAPTGPVVVSVDTTLDRRVIHPWIYGVSRHADPGVSTLPFPFERWGGNSTTRYDWTTDTRNSAGDWFFCNYANPTDVSKLPNGSTVDRWIDGVRARGAEALLTVPLIGWTPRDRVRRWGFSVAKYGAQQTNECIEAGWPGWCQEDMGNGRLPGGAPLTGNDPRDTSREIGPSYVTDWMDHLASRMGRAGEGGLTSFALDNEVMLWSDTHRDVHPNRLGGLELWQRTVDTASAMKANAPGAQLWGPVTWGWCDIFWTDLDGCGNDAGPDHSARGDFLEWYLGQAAAYQAVNGVSLVDWLDIHYYPQGNGIALSNVETEPTATNRLQSVRSLWDPAWVDASWIADVVRLIPRMRDLIAAKKPGTKLAITEYSWGNDDGLTSALAQAEVLALFGREGVDAAARWVAPMADTRVEDAFRLFLAPQGAGTAPWGESVRAVADREAEVGAYAIRAFDGRLMVLLVNRTIEARTVNVTVAGGLAALPTLIGFDAGQRLGPAGSATSIAGGFSVSMPARSLRMAIGALPCSVPGEATALRLAKGAGNAVTFSWTGAPAATDHVVVEETNPAGLFVTPLGASSAGSSTVSLPVGAGIHYFKVLGRNACGRGSGG